MAQPFSIPARLRSFLYAGRGLSHMLQTQHNAWLHGVSTVGLTSGASVPDELVMRVLDHLADRGFTDVAEVTTAEETLTFALPRELKRDLAAAAAARAREAAALAETVSSPRRPDPAAGRPD